MTEPFTYTDRADDDLTISAAIDSVVLTTSPKEIVVAVDDVATVIIEIARAAGVDFAACTVGLDPDGGGDPAIYTGRTREEHVTADYKSLDAVLRELIALHREESTDE